MPEKNQPHTNDCDAYRAQHWSVRAARPLCAESVAIVISAWQAGARVGNISAERLAQDLSGRYEPFSVQLVGEHTGTVRLDGSVYDDAQAGEAGDPPEPVGGLIRRFSRDVETSEIVANHDLLYLYPRARRRGGFSTSLWREIEPYYRASGVARVELQATLEDGGYVWARAGYDWDPTPWKLERSLEKCPQSRRADGVTSRHDAK